jgi:hypothetical protein
MDLTNNDMELVVESPKKKYPYKDVLTPEYEKYRDRQLRQKRQYRKNHPERILWYSAKRRAKQEGIEFTINPSDVVIPEMCPILNIPIKTGKLSDNSPSIDRLDSSRGYTKDNIKVISFLANTMKSSASKELIKVFCENIFKYLG